MADESMGQRAEAGSEHSSVHAAAGHEEGGAGGMLREAIQKVMAEIEHHENLAKRHLEQATALRKTLRDSISFLHEQAEKKTPLPIPAGSRLEKGGRPSVDDKGTQGVSSNQHRRSKRK